LLVAAACSVATARHSREAVRVALPFETVKTAKLMIVRVTIVGKTGDFLFDAGDELTLVDRESLIEQARLLAKSRHKTLNGMFREWLEN